MPNAAANDAVVPAPPSHQRAAKDDRELPNHIILVPLVPLYAALGLLTGPFTVLAVLGVVALFAGAAGAVCRWREQARRAPR